MGLTECVCVCFLYCKNVVSIRSDCVTSYENNAKKYTNHRSFGAKIIVFIFGNENYSLIYLVGNNYITWNYRFF